MSRCIVCGANSDRIFTLTTRDGEHYTFDCFECAIDRMAPRCAYCGLRIIGHGISSSGSFFCSPHCAQFLGIDGFV